MTAPTRNMTKNTCRVCDVKFVYFTHPEHTTLCINCRRALTEARELSTPTPTPPPTDTRIRVYAQDLFRARARMRTYEIYCIGIAQRLHADQRPHPEICDLLRIDQATLDTWLAHELDDPEVL